MTEDDIKKLQYLLHYPDDQILTLSVLSNFDFLKIKYTIKADFNGRYTEIVLKSKITKSKFVFYWESDIFEISYKKGFFQSINLLELCEIHNILKKTYPLTIFEVNMIIKEVAEKVKADKSIYE